MDFVTYMMDEMIKDTKLSLGKCCKHAYKKALEPHHPFIIRTAAKAAWLVAPEKSKFYHILCGFLKFIFFLFFTIYFLIIGNAAKTEADVLKICQLHIDAFAPIRSTLWAYYEKNKLIDLP